MITQAQVVTNHLVVQANLGVRPQPKISTPVSRIQDFMRMNPPTFHGTKVDKHTQGFIDEVFNVVDAMGVTLREKAELVAYQLKDVAKVWFEKCVV